MVDLFPQMPGYPRFISKILKFITKQPLSFRQSEQNRLFNYSARLLMGDDLRRTVGSFLFLRPNLLQLQMQQSTESFELNPLNRSHLRELQHSQLVVSLRPRSRSLFWIQTEMAPQYYVQ